MRRVRFKTDYRGKLTQEVFYRAGSEAEFSDPVAAELVARGWVCEYVQIEAQLETVPIVFPVKGKRTR